MALSWRHQLQLNCRYGRRPALLLIILGLLVVKILSASSRYYIMYVVCRFLVALFTSSFSTVSFTLGKLPNTAAVAILRHPSEAHLRLISCEISFVFNIDSSCPIVLELESGSITVMWLYVTERWIMDNRDLTRLEFKKSFKGYPIAQGKTSVRPWTHVGTPSWPWHNGRDPFFQIMSWRIHA